MASDNEDLPWFFRGGTRKPKPECDDEKRCQWKEEVYSYNRNRVTNSLMLVPKMYNKITSPMKIILAWQRLPIWLSSAKQIFMNDTCPVNRCVVSEDRQKLKTADAILFLDSFENPYEHHKYKRSPKQIWIYRSHESPYHRLPRGAKNFINWTMTYREDSEIPSPYGLWVYYDGRVQRSVVQENYARKKTRQVLWIVSNCLAQNDRLEYAKELRKYISVDIYGSCGSLKCSKTSNCFHSLGALYKFYLAFENSNCIEYITEKFFVSALQNDLLPIAMGARPEDYASVAPRHSYIHVDDFSSPKELAQFLHVLDTDDDFYNSYFRWKGTGEFIEIGNCAWCSLCSMLHEPVTRRVYSDVNKWLMQGTCIKSRPWPKKKIRSANLKYEKINQSIYL